MSKPRPLTRDMVPTVTLDYQEWDEHSIYVGDAFVGVVRTRYTDDVVGMVNEALARILARELNCEGDDD